MTCLSILLNRKKYATRKIHEKHVVHLNHGVFFSSFWKIEHLNAIQWNDEEREREWEKNKRQLPYSLPENLYLFWMTFLFASRSRTSLMLHRYVYCRLLFFCRFAQFTIPRLFCVFNVVVWHLRIIKLWIFNFISLFGPWLLLPLLCGSVWLYNANPMITTCFPFEMNIKSKQNALPSTLARSEKTLTGYWMNEEPKCWNQKLAININRRVNHLFFFS